MDASTPGRGAGLSGDLWGGLASMLVALPSSIAFGVLVYTAIGSEYAGAGAVAGALGAATLGLVTPFVSQNGGFVTAPCAPAAAVMGGLAGELTARGLPVARVVALLGLAALLSACFQVLYGSLGLGRLIKYIPYQVVTGYLSGVAVIIATTQLPKLLGVPGHAHLVEGLIHPGLWRWEGIVVGITTIVVTVLAPRVTKAVPGSILGLLAGVVAYLLLGVLNPELMVLQDNPLVVGELASPRQLISVVTGAITSYTTVRPADVGLVIAGAGTLSVLLSIDTLKTGVVLDALTRSRTRSNRELVAQGIGNAVNALVGGMPGAGTMGPTLVNVTSGGRSPRSGFFEGFASLLAFLLLGRLVAWVPIGALAGILLVVAWRMFDWSVFKLVTRPETRLDFVVVALVVVIAETVGLIEASISGIALAILLFIRDQTKTSVLQRKRDLSEVHSKTHRPDEARDLLDEHGSEGILVELGGNLFFGTTDQLFEELSEDLDQARYVLLDMRKVQSMDYTAGHLFHQMQERLEERGGSLLFSGMPTALPTGRDVERYLAHLGLDRKAGVIQIFDLRDEALVWMEDHVLEAAGWVPGDPKRPLELGEFSLFREFDADTVAALASIASEVHLADGERLFERKDKGDDLFLVRRGAVRALLPLKGSEHFHHVATFERGEPFGELSFLDRRKRSADAVGVGETDLYAISRDRFDELVHGDALIGTKVFARLARQVSSRLRGANKELRSLEQR